MSPTRGGRLRKCSRLPPCSFFPHPTFLGSSIANILSSVEAQAIDRVHRMGQTQKVEVVRFIVKDSIEERMLRIQEKKMAVAGTLGVGQSGGDGGDDEKKRRRVEELELLLG